MNGNHSETPNSSTSTTGKLTAELAYELGYQRALDDLDTLTTRISTQLHQLGV